MEFTRQKYWSGLPFSFPRALPDPGIEPGFPVLQVDSLLIESPGKLSQRRLLTKLNRRGDFVGNPMWK